MTTILVVDDEPAILRTLRAGLTARGYEVITAASGREALNELTLRAPDAVILDLGLGDIGGVEICRTVREWSDVPIIVLSAEDSDHRKVMALETLCTQIGAVLIGLIVIWSQRDDAIVVGLRTRQLT